MAKRKLTADEKRAKCIEHIKKMCLLDDAFMTKCFENDIQITELSLRIILDNPEIKVKRVTTQHEIKNLFGHGTRLDVFAEDANGKPMDIEIQRADKGAGAKRARYYSSIIDANALTKSANYEELPESYVIFITESDVLNGGLQIYHIERTIKEQSGREFGDGAHIIYVNSEIQDTTPLGRLMHDFQCTDPTDMHYKELAEKVRYFKESEKGVADMGRIIEDWMLDWVEEGREEGRAEGREEGRAEGREEAREEARKEVLETALLDSIKNIVLSLKLTPQAAMDALKIPTDEQPKYLAML